MQLLYTLRPAGDDIDLGDQSDATFVSSTLQLPTIRVLSAQALVADTHTDDNALIQYVIVRARAKVTNPQSQTEAKLSLAYDTGEFVEYPVAMWGTSFEERVSDPIYKSPLDEDWTLAAVLALFLGSQVKAQKTQGGPNVTFAGSELALDVYGIPSAELSPRKFESGVYRLVLDSVPYVSHLSVAETRAVHIAAQKSGIALTLSALVLDNGSYSSGDSYEINSTYQGLLDAIASGGGGAQLPPEV